MLPRFAPDISRLKKIVVGDDGSKLGSWTIGAALTPVSIVLSMPPAAVFIFAFSGYWIVPGLYAAADGTLFSRQDVTGLFHTSSGIASIFLKVSSMDKG